ncbi:hypothetical protein RYX36_001362 [Vicia faba]
MKFQHVILIFVVVILACVVTNHAEIVNFAIDPINPNDPYVIEIANFAINEHNKVISINKLKLEKVLFVISYKTSQGTKYHLAISATHDSISIKYKVKVVPAAIVLDNPEHHIRKLESFIFP